MSENEHAHSAEQSTTSEQGPLLTSPADILGRDDIIFDYVDVPEWKQKGDDRVPRVRIKSLTGQERGKAESTMFVRRRIGGKIKTVQDVSNFYATICAYGIVDTAGNRVFTSEEQTKALGKKHAGAVSRIAKRISEISNMSEEDLEELVGNSESDPGATG